MLIFYMNSVIMQLSAKAMLKYSNRAYTSYFLVKDSFSYLFHSSTVTVTTTKMISSNPPIVPAQISMLGSGDTILAL